ncbi:MAG: hypothetical protein JWN39_2604, partial [Ilumatobacteraceae bacterium]|nr:hypothetical protein [Ilumatobacteraceae bacterium]
MNTQSDRAARFVADLGELKIKDPSADRPVIMLRLSSGLMLVSVAIGVVAYFMSHGTTNPLTQNDAVVLGLLAVTLAVVSGLVYLRFALTNFL